MADPVRKYPRSPLPAVGAFVVRAGSVLLVKRAAPPSAGRWSVPGGVIERGETVEVAALREVREECGIGVRALGAFNVADLIERDEEGRVRFHYVLIDVACDFVSGDLTAGSDAADARWVPMESLHEYDISETALAALRVLRGRRA